VGLLVVARLSCQSISARKVSGAGQTPIALWAAGLPLLRRADGGIPRLGQRNDCVSVNGPLGIADAGVGTGATVWAAAIRPGNKATDASKVLAQYALRKFKAKAPPAAHTIIEIR